MLLRRVLPTGLRISARWQKASNGVDIRGRMMATFISPQSGPRYADLVPMYRSALFVPVDSEKKLRKSIACGADVCLLDLEDGVAPNRKKDARQLLSGLLPELHSGYGTTTDSLVRLNSHGAVSEDGGAEFESDVDLLASLPELPKVVGLSKIDSPRDVEICMTRLDKALPRDKGPLGIFLMVESPESVMYLRDICTALLQHAQENRFLPGGLIFGHMDYCSNLGIDITTTDRSKLTYAEQAIVTAAKAFRLQAMDCVFTVVKDLDGMRADCLHGSQTGFTSKCAIHPTHVGIANEVFSPAQDRIDWARGLLEASERHKQQGEGVFVYEGQLVDAPVFRRAQSTMAATKRMLR